MPAIHQLVAGFSNGDAISNESLVLRDVFRSWGFASEIFSEARRILPELRKQAHDIAAYEEQSKPDDVALLHLSIGSAVNTLFPKLPCRKAILYHNATPSHYFDLVNPETARNLAVGREQIKSLAGAAEVNMADSRFNADEMVEMGYGHVDVLPLVLDFDALTASRDAAISRRFDDGKTNILFVGRCVPNKRIEDALQAFYCYHRRVNPNSRFIHVGSSAGSERYYYLLVARAKEMDLQNVHFLGSVPQAWLNAAYARADLFLCMSEHEGFCIPVLESMAAGIPVLAYSAGAVPETMAGAGVLFHEKDYAAVAEMMGLLTSDSPLRKAILGAQRERIERYRARELAAELHELLSPVLPR